MNLPITTTPEADAQIRAIDDWWRENRRVSPDLFFEGLSTVFDLIARAPHVGRRYGRSPVPGVRRILLKGTRHHVYYVPNEHEVRVLAVWHGERGVGPSLRTL